MARYPDLPCSLVGSLGRKVSLEDWGALKLFISGVGESNSGKDSSDGGHANAAGAGARSGGFRGKLPTVRGTRAVDVRR